MSEATMKMRFKRDIHAPLTTQRPITLLMQGDALANEIRIDLTEHDAPYTPDGYTVEARLIRSDGHRVRCEGRIEESTVHVSLDAGCYEAPGNYAMYVRLISADKSVRRTILRIAGEIESEGSGPLINGNRVFYSIEDLLAQIDKMENATKEAETQASAAQKAAEKIENMTVSAQDGEVAKAQISEVNGVKHIDFTMRRGAPGYGLRFLGIYSSYEQLESFVPSASQGDMYLVGTGTPYKIFMYNNNYGSEYSYWLNIGEASGIGVVSLAGKYPDENGNIDGVTSINGLIGDVKIATNRVYDQSVVDYSLGAGETISSYIRFSSPFMDEPIITPFQKGSAPGQIFFSLDNITNQGFSITIRNNGNNNFEGKIQWYAYDTSISILGVETPNGGL